MNLIEVENLTVSYSNNIVLDSISINIKSGEYLCLLGVNGSGKSTFVKTILGIEKKETGNIKYNILKEEISYLPQMNEVNREFPATVKEIVIMGTQTKGKVIPFYNAKDYTAAENAMKEFNIFDLKNKQISELSGGQMQRMLLARAFCKEPKLIILDEPTAGLDMESTNELYELLVDINKNKKVSILLITHDLKEINENVDRIIEISDKKIKLDKPYLNWIKEELEVK